jgi:Protein of unknown function (DUF3025)
MSELGFLEHPAFAIFDESVRARLAALGHFPEPHEFRALTRGIPSAPTPCFEFEPEDAESVRKAGGFDRFIANTARIPTRRGSYHDLFGGLVWLHFPQMKRAIHRIQLAHTGGQRSARENAATHFDESGVIVASSDVAVLHALGAFDWPEIFWHRRAALLETTRFHCFGHGLLDALRVPHPRLLGMALFVHVSPARLALAAPEFRLFLDRELARRLPEFLVEPARLQPLPVLGVPGWSGAQSAEFYANERYFRRARQRLRATSPATFVALD